MENLIIKLSSQIKIPKITWTLILELTMKKSKVCIYNSFLIFRTIPQFKLSHEHKKRQQFSVCKPEEKNRCWEVSQRLKNTTFLSTLLSFISLSKRKLNTTTWKEKNPKILIRSATQPRNDKHLFLIPTYLFSSKNNSEYSLAKYQSFVAKNITFHNAVRT